MNAGIVEPDMLNRQLFARRRSLAQIIEGLGGQEYGNKACDQRGRKKETSAAQHRQATWKFAIQPSSANSDWWA